MLDKMSDREKKVTRLAAATFFQNGGTWTDLYLDYVLTFLKNTNVPETEKIWNVCTMVAPMYDSFTVGEFKAAFEKERERLRVLLIAREEQGIEVEVPEAMGLKEFFACNGRGVVIG